MLMKCWTVPARKLCCTQRLLYPETAPNQRNIPARVQNSYFPEWLSFFHVFFSAGFGKDSDKMTVLVFVLSPSF